MISVEAALEKILSHIQPLGFEKVSLLESQGRVIAEDIYASRDIPPLDNSGMDGYAVRYEDIQHASSSQPVRLEIIEDLPAGSVSKKTLEKGQAIRIMTGAPIPRGSDAVIPVEETAKEGNEAVIFKATVPGD